jgi:hypothetical protein
VGIEDALLALDFDLAAFAILAEHEREMAERMTQESTNG